EDVAVLHGDDGVLDERGYLVVLHEATHGPVLCVEEPGDQLWFEGVSRNVFSMASTDVAHFAMRDLDPGRARLIEAFRPSFDFDSGACESIAAQLRLVG